NYRRFFDINNLAGLRVEDRATFESIHRLVIRLVGEGCLDGLRFDHIDGLRDPHQYFRRVQSAVAAASAGRKPIYCIVEKILAAGHYTTRDYAAESLRAAFELFILHFPVYRTYITGSGPSGRDRAIIETTLAKARAEWFGPDSSVFDFLGAALTLDLIKGEHV